MADGIRCFCCGGSEPAAGWHIYAVIDGAIDEAYCSKNCFVAHEDGTCGCFIEDEFTLPLGDEDWDG